MTSHPKNCYLNIHSHKNLKSCYKIPHHVILVHLALQNCCPNYFHSGIKRWWYKSRGKRIMVRLTLYSLTERIWWVPNNTIRWHMGFNSAFTGLRDSKKKENANRSSSETMNRDISWRKYEARKHTRSLMVLWCLFTFVFEDITLQSTHVKWKF